MARTSTTTEEVIIRRRHRYIWPDFVINVWILVMLVTAGVLLGIFASFVQIQNRFGVGIPWLFPFALVVGSLTVLFIFFILFLIANRNLLPFLVVLFSFTLWALYLTGLIETAIQLFGPHGNVNNVCQTYVVGMPQSGPTINTLAWLEQNSICNQWYAAFAFFIIGNVFLLWIMIIARQVSLNQYNY